MASRSEKYTNLQIDILVRNVLSIYQYPQSCSYIHRTVLDQSYMRHHSLLKKRCHVNMNFNTANNVGPFWICVCSRVIFTHFDAWKRIKNVIIMLFLENVGHQARSMICSCFFFQFRLYIVSDFLHSKFQYFTFAYDLHNYILLLHIDLYCWSLLCLPS